MVVVKMMDVKVGGLLAVAVGEAIRGAKGTSTVATIRVEEVTGARERGIIGIANASTRY